MLSKKTSGDNLIRLVPTFTFFSSLKIYDHSLKICEILQIL